MATLVIQNEGCQDSSIYRNFPDSNYGSSTSLTIVGNISSLLKFDNPLDVSGLLLLSGSLALYAYDVESSTTVSVYVHPCLADWDAAVVTWNNAPDFGSSVTTTNVSSKDTWYNFDISGVVREWLYVKRENYGVHLRFTSLNEYKTFYSSKYDVDPLLCPKWTLTYAKVTPVYPTGTQALPTAINDSVTPYFICGYEAHAGELMAYKQVQVFDEADNKVYDSGKIKPALNMLTPNQADVESDTTGFTEVAGATISRDSNQHLHGHSSLKIKPRSGFADTGVKLQAGTEAGKTYTFSVYSKATAPTTVRLLALDTTVDMEFSDNNWLRGEITFTATGATTDIFILSNDMYGITFYVDMLQLEEGASAGMWRPGGHDYTEIPLGHLKYGKKYKWRFRGWHLGGVVSNWTDYCWFKPILTKKASACDIAGSDHLYSITPSGNVVALEEGTSNLDKEIAWYWVGQPYAGGKYDKKQMLERVWFTLYLPEGSTMDICYSMRLKDMGDGEDWLSAKSLTPADGIQVVEVTIPVASGEEYLSYWQRIRLSGTGAFEVYNITYEYKERRF